MHIDDDSETVEVLDLGDIDIEMLGMVLASSDWAAGCFDPQTGEVIQAFDGEVMGEDGEPVDPDDLGWVFIEGEGSRPSYRDMERFAAEVGDPALAGRLSHALQGRGAFGHFRNEIHHGPETLRKAWFDYRDARQRGRAIAWLEAHSYVRPEQAAEGIAAADEAAEHALAQARGTEGAHCEATELPTRWPDLVPVLERGESVVLTQDGHPWASIQVID